MMVMIVRVIEAVLCRIFTEKTFLDDIDFLELMKCAVDGDQITFSWVFAFFKLGHDLFGGLWCRSNNEAVDDLLALGSHLHLVFAHFSEDSIFRGGFVVMGLRILLHKTLW